MKWSSYEAYQSVLNDLPGARQKVFRHLFRNGPCTGRELNDAMGSQSAHKRLSELERQGLIFDAGTRTCRISGHESHEWSVIGEGPLLEVIAAGGVSSLPRAVKPTRGQLEAEIAHLKKENDELRSELLRLRSVAQDRATALHTSDWRARQLCLLGGKNEEQ